MVQIYRVFRHRFVLGGTSKKSVAKVLLAGTKPRRVEKFRDVRLRRYPREKKKENKSRRDHDTNITHLNISVPTWVICLTVGLHDMTRHHCISRFIDNSRPCRLNGCWRSMLRRVKNNCRFIIIIIIKSKTK